MTHFGTAKKAKPGDIGHCGLTLPQLEKAELLLPVVPLLCNEEKKALLNKEIEKLGAEEEGELQTVDRRQAQREMLLHFCRSLSNGRENLADFNFLQNICDSPELDSWIMPTIEALALNASSVEYQSKCLDMIVSGRPGVWMSDLETPPKLLSQFIAPARPVVSRDHYLLISKAVTAAGKGAVLLPADASALTRLATGENPVTLMAAELPEVPDLRCHAMAVLYVTGQLSPERLSLILNSPFNHDLVSEALNCRTISTAELNTESFDWWNAVRGFSQKLVDVVGKLDEEHRYRGRVPKSIRKLPGQLQKVYLMLAAASDKKPAAAFDASPFYASSDFEIVIPALVLGTLNGSQEEKVALQQLISFRKVLEEGSAGEILFAHNWASKFIDELPLKQIEIEPALVFLTKSAEELKVLCGISLSRHTNLGNAALVESLTDLLHSQNKLMVLETLDAFHEGLRHASSHPEKTRKALVSLLKNEDPLIVRQMSQFFFDLEADTPDYLSTVMGDFIEGFSRSRDAEVQCELCAVLERCGPSARAALNDLTLLLFSDNNKVRKAAKRAVQAINGEAVEESGQDAGDR